VTHLQPSIQPTSPRPLTHASSPATLAVDPCFLLSCALRPFSSIPSLLLHLHRHCISIPFAIPSSSPSSTIDCVLLLPFRACPAVDPAAYLFYDPSFCPPRAESIKVSLHRQQQAHTTPAPSIRPLVPCARPIQPNPTRLSRSDSVGTSSSVFRPHLLLVRPRTIAYGRIDHGTRNAPRSAWWERAAELTSARVKWRFCNPSKFGVASAWPSCNLWLKHSSHYYSVNYN
jgi:hypothetical protein